MALFTVFSISIDSFSGGALEENLTMGILEATSSGLLNIDQGIGAWFVWVRLRDVVD